MRAPYEGLLIKLAAAGGEIDATKLRGYLPARLCRYGYAEWVRPPNKPTGTAIALRITDSGKDYLKTIGVIRDPA